jgi:hypothetical protein
MNAIPWSASTATDVAQPFTIPGVPPCQAADLDVSVHAVASYIGGGPRNTSTWTITVKDKGTAPCFVGSTVEVGFATAAGTLSLPAMRTLGGDIVYLAPASAPASPRFSHEASGEIDTFPCVVPPVTQMAISPAAGLGIVLVNPGPAGGLGTTCPGKPQSYLAELYPENCCRGYAASTQTAMDAPAAAHRGDHLRFLVTITNRPVSHSELAGTAHPTPTPMTFTPCPTYHEELEGVAGTFHTYQLNCEQAAPIQANASETFEMYVDLPADTHPGPAVLVWSIDGSPTIYQTARANIEINS